MRWEPIAVVAVCYAACALPDDFVKVDSVSGAGGMGAQGGSGAVGGGGASSCGPTCDGDCEATDVAVANDEALGMVLFGDPPDRIVWATGYGNQLLSSPLEGGAPSILYSGSTYVTMVATDGVHAYFTRYGDGEIWRVDPDEGDITAERIVDDTGHATEFGRIAVDSTNVYWASQSTDSVVPAVWYAPKDGGAAVSIYAMGYPYGVASDDNHLYWTDENAEVVYRCALSDLDACTPEPFATGQTQPSEIVVQGDTVYWLASGAVYAKPTDGGPVSILGDAANDNTGLALDDTHVYWTANGDGLVLRTPIDGVGETVEVLQITEPVSIAVGCTDVVVTTSLGSASPRLVRFDK